MAELVNLRQFRKHKAREEKAETAKTNRILHGRSKAEKELVRSRNVKELRSHEAGRLERPSATGDDVCE